jgi:hypothetical protein
MAAVVPVSANKCVGSYADNTPNIQLYCLDSLDDQGQPVYTCVTWRKFRANCPKINTQCSAVSEAYVAASVICRQRLF